MKNKEIVIIDSKQDVQDMEPLFSKYLIEKKENTDINTKITNLSFEISFIISKLIICLNVSTY